MQKLLIVVSLALAARQALGVAVWGQCGGKGYSGSTVCDTGSVCTYSNDYYSQCIPGTAPPTPTPTPMPTPTSQPPTSIPTTSDSPTLTSPTSSGPSPTAGACSPASSPISGYSNAKLPNPFLFADGKTTVTSKAQWTCRAQEIQNLVLGYEGGALPPKPPKVSGSYSGGTLTVSAGLATGNPVSWTNKITYPSGTAPAGGWPLLIALGGGSIPVPAGIATLNYNQDTIAAQNDQSSRGVGLFYTLYGKSATASAMVAWAWGASRIIDVLEQTPSANINTKAIAVTGCSRLGKGALTVGALEPRIALTVPQESGAGGDACWRLTAYENQNGGAAQPADEIVTENVWFSTNFNNYVKNLNALPYDHHSLAASIAPRALLSYENTDYQWLSPMSGYGCMYAAHTVFQALGVPQNHGFVQVGGHSHCAFPSSLTNSLNAFFQKFLQGQSVSTDFFTTNNQFGGPKFTPSSWIDWTTPTLS